MIYIIPMTSAGPTHNFRRGSECVNMLKVPLNTNQPTVCTSIIHNFWNEFFSKQVDLSKPLCSTSDMKNQVVVIRKVAPLCVRPNENRT